MTDGLSRQTKISKPLKKFSDVLYDENSDSHKCSTSAKHCVVQELFPYVGLLNDLAPVGSQDQMDAIFEAHDRSQFAHDLQKKCNFFQANENDIQSAITKASSEMITECYKMIEDRLRQEDARIQDDDARNSEKYQVISEKLRVACSEPDIQNILKALQEGKKDAFKVVVNKEK